MNPSKQQAIEQGCNFFFWLERAYEGVYKENVNWIISESQKKEQFFSEMPTRIFCRVDLFEQFLQIIKTCN